MSPILLRPVREQLEHDRVIRLLQAKYKRKFEVALNLGNEQKTGVPIGQSTWFPDLVLQSTEKSRKIMGLVEVETAESVNKVEAMSQWGAFGRARAPFHLYVPASMIDVARQLCSDLQVTVAEIWAYNALGDQIRFTLIQRSSRSDDKPRPASAARSGAAPRAGAAQRAGTARRTAAAASRSRTARPAAARTARRTAAAPRRKAAKPASRAGSKKTSRSTRAHKRR